MKNNVLIVQIIYNNSCCQYENCSRVPSLIKLCVMLYNGDKIKYSNFNLLCTTRVAAFSSSPRILRAMHLYFPASSKRTSSICIRPSDVALILSLGTDPLILTQDSLGAGFPVAEQNRAAVLLLLTVTCESGEIVTFGAEIDSPGSPLIPGIPGAPISPLIPFSPLIPDGPITPCFPARPGGPMIPWDPFLPLFPGGPGLPRGQALKLPVLLHNFFNPEKNFIAFSSTCLMLVELLDGGFRTILRAILTKFASLFPFMVFQ